MKVTDSKGIKMSKNMFRVVITMFVLIFAGLAFSAVSAQNAPVTVPVRPSPLLEIPPATWPIMELTEVQRITDVAGNVWVEVGHRTWPNAWVLGLDWDAAIGNPPVNGAQQPAAPQVISPTATPIVAPPAAQQQGCSYRPGFAGGDGGVRTNSGTIVGPAIVKVAAFDIIAVYPGMSYTVTADSVYWEYQGDSDCLQSQFMYFPGATITKIH